MDAHDEQKLVIMSRSGTCASAVRRMATSSAVTATFALLLAFALPASAINNAVVQWQNALEGVVRTYNISNQISAKFYALSNIAQYQVSEPLFQTIMLSIDISHD